MHNRLIRPGSLIAAALVGAVAAVTGAAAAFAHAEVTVEPAQAGATDALVTVVPEAHNHHAGATSVQVFLPEGIDPADVTLADGPAGWTLTTDTDSYTVAGPELEIDLTPEHQVRIRQLPDAPVIYFRILTTYADGQVDRWIELPSAANPSPAGAAAGAELAAAQPSPSPDPPSPTPPARPSPTPGQAGTGAVDNPGDGGGNTGLIVAIIAAVVAAAAATAFVVSRRRGAATPS